MTAAARKRIENGTLGQVPKSACPWLSALLAACTCAAVLLVAVPPAPAMAEGEVEGAGLFFSDGDGDLHAAPIVHTDAYLKVTGIILRAQITQEFFNPSEDWVEGLYFFPLPGTAAVDSLRMIVGTRVIEGRIQEKAEARRTYEQAKTEGKKASLLVQKRPNVFRVDVANIGPRESVQVIIEFQDTLRYDSGEFRLRLPTLVAPRYDPGVVPASEAFLSRDTAMPDGFAADACTGSDTATSTLTLSVDVRPGFPLKWLHSPSHAVRIVEAESSFLVSLDGNGGLADRDFVLVWAPRVGHVPAAAVFREETEEEDYLLLMLLPPDGTVEEQNPLPRETIFVIDTSGSMYGPSLDQAKLALLLALDSLSGEDSFNVIQFNTLVTRLYPESVPATPAAREQARLYVDSLTAEGGTVMLPALRAALEDQGHWKGIRQVVFITDGAVANEDELFSFITAFLGESRLFTVGIGNAPNSHFMRKAAQFGRGTFMHIGTPEEVSERMQSLFEKLRVPVLTDLTLDWGNPGAEAWPNPIPDLYAGEPVVVAARLSAGTDSVRVGGLRDGTSWQEVLSLRGGTETTSPPKTVTNGSGQGIGKLWARRRVEALMDGIVQGMDRDTVRDAVIALGLRYNLITQYTSLVAVDVTPTAPRGAAALARRVAPVARNRAGALPATATPMRFDLLLGVLFFLAAAALRRRGAAPCR